MRFLPGARSPTIPLRGSRCWTAETVAQAFRRTASELNVLRQQTDRDLRSTADQVNGLAARLQEYNALRQRGGRTDAGLDAQIHATLEELAELVNFSTLYQDDGTVTVLLHADTAATNPLAAKSAPRARAKSRPLEGGDFTRPAEWDLGARR